MISIVDMIRHHPEFSDVINDTFGAYERMIDATEEHERDHGPASRLGYDHNYMAAAHDLGEMQTKLVQTVLSILSTPITDFDCEMIERGVDTVERFEARYRNLVAR